MSKRNERIAPAGPHVRAKKGTFKRIMSYLGAYKFQFTVVIVCIVISAAVTIASSVAMETLLKYVDPAEGDPNVQGFVSMLITLGIVFAFGILTGWLFNRLMLNVSEGVMHNMRVDLFGKMQKLPIRYFDTHNVGDLMSAYTNDTDTLRQMLSNSLPQMISSVITITGVFVMMLYYNLLLTAISIVLFLLMLLIAGKIGGNAGKYFLKQQVSIGKVNGYIEEMIEGQKVVKVFNHEQAAQAGFDAINTQLREDSRSANIFANILMPVMMNFSNIVYVVVAIIGAVFAIVGLFPEGGVLPAFGFPQLVAYLMLVKNISHPLGTVGQQFNSVIMALAGADRIFTMMDETPESDDGTVTLVRSAEEGIFDANCEWYWKRALADGETEYVPMRGDVRFKDVTFGYNDDKIVLHDVSLYAKPGQKIAFVGSTGAGKTTITNLINRFYDIQSGTITYDGIPIREIAKPSLRKSLAIVLQDTHLFTGSVMDNIRYGKLDATDEACIAAAKLANAHRFIKHLPKGYDTVLTGDGDNLSQGQRQLLAIARAAVAGAPVLILDEATSSIDTRTESLIEKGMDQLMEGRTVFVIAHRLSTVRNSQAIMVLENGRIIERGDHDDLIGQRGKYYQLYTGAFELS